VSSPDVAVDEGYDDGGAQEDEDGAEMMAPVQIEPIDPGRGVAAEGESKELKENPQGHAGPSLEKTAERDGDQQGQDEDRNRRERSLCIQQSKHIRK